MDSPSIHNIFLVFLLSAGFMNAVDLPDYYGKKIDRIEFSRMEIFNPEDPEESAWPYRLVNGLHFLSKESFIRQLILFREGDLLDPGVIEASERRLRATGLFNPVSITILDLSEGTVLVRVFTRDTWTTKPGATFNSYGGKTTYSLALEEDNFLGWGKRVFTTFEREAEQKKWSFFYEDPMFVNHLNRVFAGWWKTDDGEGSQVFLFREFFTPKQKIGFRLGMLESDDRIQHYWQGDRALEFTLGSSWYLGEIVMRLRNWEESVVRGGVGYTYLVTENNLKKEYELDHPYWLDQEQYTRRYPYLFFEYKREKYLKIKGLYGFTHDEDMLIGPRIRMGIGSSGGNEWDMYADAEAGLGNEIFHQGFKLLISQSRLNDANHVYYLAAYQGSYHWNPDSISSYAVRIDGFSHPESTEVLYLDSLEGLRGTGYRDYAGNRRAHATLQHKICLWKNFLHLVNIGFAGFVDVGKIWGLESDYQDAEWRKSIGVGLRIESLRSGFSTLGRIDFGYSLDDEGFEIVVTTGEWFDWRKPDFYPVRTVSPSHAIWWQGR